MFGFVVFADFDVSVSKRAFEVETVADAVALINLGGVSHQDEGNYWLFVNLDRVDAIDASYEAHWVVAEVHQVCGKHG